MWYCLTQCCQHVIFQTYSCRGVGTHLKPLCIHFLLGIQAVEVGVNRVVAGEGAWMEPGN